ncbi:cdk-activating kinase assembly factor mat1 [Ophiostoma piceae UAMH 11346]|uniref:RNA polymerase II transcription factor B subunit 3 n=1 Tax=Ophiostoma piceae (strain UAMH 11346) TaxID=1262450 RepID=S3C9S8_OPHP1|nr:cdk-activating kinase assembly factor mat1 [Ophiostoma piceae UAMH 11346]
MSRKFSGRGPATVPPPTTNYTSSTTELVTSGGTQNGGIDDICPVCKTIRYLNKDMVFLINPECYHPMCSNCVNRLFTGPNQCPYAGCHKTLRRKDFRKAFFDDLTVEREVDIRRRVANIFNQGQDDFESLDDYNEHLEKVEALTMDLVGSVLAARRAAEAELSRWEADHRTDIEKNRRRGERADEQSKMMMAAEKDAAKKRRLEALRQDEEDRRAKVRDREADLDSLVSAPDNDGGVAAGRILLRRRGQHQREGLLSAEEQTLSGSRGDSSLTIRGLKDKKKLATTSSSAIDGPYDPFEGLDPAPSRYRVQQGEYRNPWLQGAREHNSHVVGGYDVHEYCARALFDAFSGLAVFVDDEKETGEGTSAAAVATLGASMAATDPADVANVVKMEVDTY